MNKQQQEKAPEQGVPQRKTYVRPALTEYGNVRDFTRGGGSKSKDFGTFFK